jgi:ferric-dicitrate binding protein FerR (iron transport regulator)
MSRGVLSFVGLCLAAAGCASHPASSPDDTGHTVSSMKSGAPRVLQFTDETIAQAANAFNRYNARKIVIDDPAIADRRVGGKFLATDPESFVAALRIMMGIQVTTVGGQGRDSGTIRLSGAETDR